MDAEQIAAWLPPKQQDLLITPFPPQKYRRNVWVKALLRAKKDPCSSSGKGVPKRSA